MRLSSVLSLLLPLGLIAVVAIACDDSTGSGETPDGGGPNLNLDGGGGNDTSVSDTGAAPAQCAPITGEGTKHPSSLNAAETWTAAGSPHFIDTNTTLNGQITLEACAEVRIGPAAQLNLGATGKLIANGNATQPVHITAKDPSAPFAKITTSAGSTIALSYVNIDGGGDPQNTVVDLTGVLDLQGADQTLPTQPTLFVDHVSITGSKSNGIVLRTGAGFAPGSKDLTISGSAQYPISIWARAVDGVPSGTYTGNTFDEILLPATGGAESMKEDATFRNRGVPYRIGYSGSQGTLYIGKGGNAGFSTVTVEAGVTMKVKKGGVIYVESVASSEDIPATGALVAVGTPAAPIVFTSAEATPAAGDWKGIWYGLTPVGVNKLDHVKVAYAGGDSSSGGAACNVPPINKSNDAAIRIFGAPPSQFVTNTTIEATAANGFDRGWRADNLTDFLSTNTFVPPTTPRCKQTYPKAANGGCPAEPIPCPN